MDQIVERVAWTLTFQDRDEDLHECGDVELVAALVVHKTGDFVDRFWRIPAWSRQGLTGVEYEPVYVELSDPADEPELQFENWPDPDLDEHVLLAPLCKETHVLALDVKGNWIKVRVAPRLVRCYTCGVDAPGELPEGTGLTISYALLDAPTDTGPVQIDLGQLIRERLRAVYSPEGRIHMPFFELSIF